MLAVFCVDKTKMLQEEVEAERKERHSSPRHSHGDSPYLGRSSNRSKGNWLAWAGCGLFVLIVVPLAPWETLLCLSPCPPTLFVFLFDCIHVPFLDLVALLAVVFVSVCTLDFLSGFVGSSHLGFASFISFDVAGDVGDLKGGVSFVGSLRGFFAGFCKRN